MAGEWNETTLESLLSFTNGRTSPDRADGRPFPVYGSNGVIGRSFETNANENSIIIGRVGTYCGSVYLSKSRCWVTDNAIRAEAINGNEPRYLYYLLNSLNLNHWRGGSGQPLLNQTILNSIKVVSALPCIQRRIAHILGALDDKIELNRRMNRTLEKMAAAIFKSWFIDFDPVRAKADSRDSGLPQQIADLFPDSFEDSELGPIPAGWAVGALGDIANSPRRGIKPAEVPPSTPYIGLQDMPRRCIALDTWGRADEVGSQKSQFNTGEILFGKLRPYFHKVGIAPVDGVCSTDILVVVPKDDHWHSYVLALVSSKEFVDYTDSHSAGTKMPRTNWKDMSRYPLAIPPTDLAQAFQEHVAGFHRRISVSVRQNRRLARLRDTLLPKLLNGEIELPATEVIERRCHSVIGNTD